jgi:hypothetical protein
MVISPLAAFVLIGSVAIEDRVVMKSRLSFWNPL